MQHSADQYPTIISFAIGAEYYHDNARRLASQCDDLGLNHSIEHLEDDGTLDWAQICRLKIQFYRKKVHELGRPVMWIDADTGLVGRPEALRNSNVDFAGILRTGYINGFDPYISSRMWSPQLLYFGTSQVVKSFLDHLCEVEERTPHAITDDYAFQEAWATFDQEMHVTLVPSKHVARGSAAPTPDTWIVEGNSGNVAEWVGKVRQHETLKNRGAILVEVAKDAMREGDMTAVELLKATSLYGYDSSEAARGIAEGIRR